MHVIQAAAALSARFECANCRAELLPVKPANPPDRRPFKLPCSHGHTCCFECLQSAYSTSLSPCCPIDGEALLLKLADVPLDSAKLRQLEGQQQQPHSMHLSEAEVLQQQHERFIKTHPFMELVPPRPGKQPSYKCLCCGVLAGPIHRALSHAMKDELEPRHQAWREEHAKPAEASAAAAPPAAKGPVAKSGPFQIRVLSGVLPSKDKLPSSNAPAYGKLDGRQDFQMSSFPIAR